MASRSERARAQGPRLTAAAVAAAALAAACPHAQAQDTHYWTIQYGPVGQLVGGQLIGGVADLSATFYNPGALALRNESSYLLSTESVQWEVVSTDAEADSRIFDSSSSRLGAAPSLLAGVLPGWLGEDTRLAWSFLTRQKLETRLGQRVTNPMPGDGVRSAAESYFDQRVEEDWAGLTISHPLSTSVGIGATWYGVYRGQRTRKELSVQGVTPDAASLAFAGIGDFDYTHYRMLVKLGVAWRTEGWNAGVSVTTPGLGVLGNGKAAYTLSIAGIDGNGDGRPDPPLLSTSTAEELDSDWRSPWAVGGGISRRAGRTRLYASAEWYGGVDRFTVVALPEGAFGADLLQQELGSVLNAGLGFEHVVSTDISLYGAFHTDFSASVGGSSSNVAISDWDLYHLSGGVSFRVHDNRFTLGASWATGGKTRPLDSPVPPQDLPPTGLDQDVAIRYSKITFLLGFVFGS
jgi:hypothetical protein